MTNPHAAAYAELGWVPIPVPAGEKGPKVPGWQNTRLPVNLDWEGNVGVLLGEPSGDLVDVDIDVPEAVEFCDLFLPEAPTFGRVGKPRSHRLVRAKVKSRRYKCPRTGVMLLELRSTGLQTVFPGSVHPSGEDVAWVEPIPDVPACDDVERRVSAAAAGALLRRHWPEGGRHEAQLALAGALLEAGWPEPFAVAFLVALSGDEAKREATVRHTAEKIKAGERVTSWGTVAKAVGEDVAEQAREWLGVAPVAAIEEGDGFRVVPAVALFAPLEEATYVITDVLRAGSLLYWAAYGSSSKTWQGLDAAVSVSMGQPWLGRFATVQGASAIVDYESGEYELRRRLQLIARGRGVDVVPGLDAVVMPGLYMGTPKFLSAMQRLADGRALVVLDSLRAASLEDENDSRIRKGLDDLRLVAEQTGCAFGILVHAKKTSGTMSTVDDREILRGSSGIYDAADVVLASFYDGVEGFDVRQCKARLGRPVAPFRVRLEDVAFGSQNGVRVVGEDAPSVDEAREREAQTLRQEVLTYVKCNPGMTRSTIEERVTGKATAIRAVLDELDNEGAVSVQTKGTTRRYWATDNVRFPTENRSSRGDQRDERRDDSSQAWDERDEPI